MLKRRLIAAMVAVLLASVGAVVLLSYVKGADRRAMAGMEVANVLLVTAPIRAGSTAESLVKRVSMRALPAKAVAAGALSTLQGITGQVATIDLQPGEQLLASRFAEPASLQKPDGVKIPTGLQQVSVSLERQRMLAGTLAPGATVGVYLSMAKEDPVPAQTALVVHKALVTKVGEGGNGAAPEVTAKGGAPAETVMVTLAVSAGNAEKIIFGAEHGTLWLSLEPVDEVVTRIPVMNSGNVYR